VAVADDQAGRVLLRRGFALEYATLAWNVAGIVVLAIAAISARHLRSFGYPPDRSLASYHPARHPRTRRQIDSSRLLPASPKLGRAADRPGLCAVGMAARDRAIEIYRAYAGGHW
jgi:hypothetical protein